MEFVTNYNRALDVLDGRCEKVSKLPSMTEPDQTYTIKELLQRFTTGLAPQVMREGQYDYDVDIDSEMHDIELDDTLTASEKVSKIIKKLNKRRDELRAEYLKGKTKNSDYKQSEEEKLGMPKDTGRRS